MIGYFGNLTFIANKISKDNDDRILIIDAGIEDDAFILIDLYNSNAEAEQLQVLSKLDSTQNIIFTGYFNLCFDLMLESSGVLQKVPQIVGAERELL